MTTTQNIASYAIPLGIFSRVYPNTSIIKIRDINNKKPLKIKVLKNKGLISLVSER